MEINPDEWFRQAEYDIGTAEYLFKGEKCFYAVFMSHLSIEKALKGLYIKKLKEAPPKTHNLLYIIELIDLTLPENMYDFVFTLNRVSIITRYPDSLKRMQTEFDREKTKEILEKSMELLKWLKAKL